MKISVIMPAYNAEKYIKEAIDSILNQTYADFEFIIINDGSSDRTEEIILSYNDPRIVYVKNEKNLGVASSLNRGLETAGGEYIARMDSDDISMPERFEKQVAYLKNHESTVVLGTAINSFDGIGFQSQKTFSQDLEDMKVDLFFSCGLAHPSVMMRRDVIRELGGYDPNYNGLEDYELWCRVIEKYEITTLPDILLRYRIHENQVTKNPSEEYRTQMHNLKMRQLQQLGIDPLCSQAEAYYRFCEGKKPNSETDIRNLNDFFELAAESNEKCKFYDSEKLISTFKSVLIQNTAKLPHNQQNAVISQSDLISRKDIASHILKQKIKKLIGK